MQPDNTELLKRLLAERILVLDGGAIIERGTHGTLMAKAGFYANLVQQLDSGIESA